MKMTFQQTCDFLEAAAHTEPPVDCGNAVLNRGIDADGNSFTLYVDAMNGDGTLTTI
ncbi:hypothetical protein [Rhodoferax lacus]|uniref:hypothetical protein n=1 Tax=Rhodoferax lacus TaxID=2184758 RepID=UPI001314314D|nr:hypothetical protein [Rhodoferax lacus]